MIRALIFGLFVALHVHAQPIKRVGYFSAASAALNAPRLAAFRKGMAQLGWMEGKDYLIDARYAEAVGVNVSRLAADTVAARPDVILTPSDDAVLALLKSTSTIPIVFAAATDPLEFPGVKTLRRPGGNATGLSTLRGPTAAKSIQLLKETFPSVRHIALLSTTEKPSAAQAKVMQSAAVKLGMQVSLIVAKNPDDIAAAVKRAPTGIQAYAVADAYALDSRRQTVLDAIRASKLPAVYCRTEWVEEGGLLSYSAPTLDNFRAAATYVDKILKGAKPGELPIEQPSRFEIGVNLKTAKALGITIPTSLLVRADKVVQ